MANETEKLFKRTEALPVPSADTESGADRSDRLRCKRSGGHVSEDRATASTGGRSQRPDRPDRRRGVRILQRVWRTLSDAQCREARGRRPEVQPFSHHRSLLADTAGIADRPQSPLLRNGRRH